MGGMAHSIYVPLFASLNTVTLGITLVVFGMMVGVWCAIAHRLTQMPAIAPAIARYGHKIVPLALMGLGMYLFIENATYRLFQ